MLSENPEFRIFTLTLEMFSSISYVRITCPVDLSHKSYFCEICLNWRQNLTAAVALSFAVAKSVNKVIIIDLTDKYIIFLIIYKVFRVEEIKTRVLVIF